MLPNIIIPGAPKAGTTSIVSILNQHPDFFVSPKKEPRFFISDEIINLSDKDPLKKFLSDTSVLNFDEYEAAYLTDSKFAIDASIQYLYYYKTTVPKIKAYLGDPYIIIILRNPVDRAVSNFMYTKKSEKCNSLVEAVKDELAGNRDYLHSFYQNYKQGLYYEQVKTFKENFTNVTVLFYEDFVNDNLSFVNSIFDTLGTSRLNKLKPVPKLNTSLGLSWTGRLLMKKYSPFRFVYKKVLPSFFDSSTYYNIKTNLKARFSKKSSDATDLLSNDDRQFLTDLYKEDVKKLMEFLNITKSPWIGF